jgi:hypothetical protein
MKTIIRTEYSGTGSPYTVATTRISTAIEMYNLSAQLADEQETGGCYGDLYEDLREWVSDKYNLYLTLHYDMFVDKDEVIFELTVYLDKRNDFDDNELYSEEIFGYIFKKLKAHFEWDWVCAGSHLDNKVKELIK